MGTTGTTKTTGTEGAGMFKVRGINDEQTFCDLCGKVNLKKTVILENVETGEVLRVGTSCAASKIHNTKSAKVKKSVALLARKLEGARKVMSGAWNENAWRLLFGACGGIERGAFVFWQDGEKHITV